LLSISKNDLTQRIDFTRFVRVATFALVVAWVTVTPARAQEAYTGGVVAADHPLASQAGAEVLKQGGNAVDAAVAASFAASVVRPMSCGIGGGGFMVIHLIDDPRTRMIGDPVSITLDYRESAPAAITADHFDKLNDPHASRWSGSAVAIPTTVEGLLAAQARFGKLGRPQVLAPAIRLAERGYTPDPHERAALDDLADWFEDNPDRKVTHRAAYERHILNRPQEEDEPVANPEQALALRLISEQGAEALRTGPIAEAIVSTVRAAGGVMTLEDLATKRIRWREPLRATFHGRTILTMPPSSSGGIVLAQVLSVIERYEELHAVELASMGHNSADAAHLIVEACKHAFADRARWLGDLPPDDPRIARLLSSEHINSVASRIDPDSIQRNRTYGWQEDSVADGQLPDDAGTSHISVVDALGNAVAMTETINLAYGSRLFVEEFGFYLNNEMDDFSARAGAINAFGLSQSDFNRPAPGRKPLSSMTPTIVLDAEGRVEIVSGASGGPRIITGTLQSILNVVVWGMNAEAAVEAPRYHHQWSPNFLAFEDELDARLIDPGEQTPAGLHSLMGAVNALQELRLGLKKKGHNIASIEKVGDVQLIRRAPDGQGFQAACDPRKGGTPAGIH